MIVDRIARWLGLRQSASVIIALRITSILTPKIEQKSTVKSPNAIANATTTFQRMAHMTLSAYASIHTETMTTLRKSAIINVVALVRFLSVQFISY